MKDIVVECKTESEILALNLFFDAQGWGHCWHGSGSGLEGAKADAEWSIINFPFVVLDFASKYQTGINRVMLETDRERGRRLYTEVPFSEVFSITEEAAKNVIPPVVLNGQYTAEVKEEGIQVGCQVISFEAFDNLAAAVKKFRKNLK